MYCSACNLEYSEQLKFCKQCGRALAQDVASSSTPLSCCTRCGARVVANENFCQQCGARTKTRIEDTTIGACARCGTHWRSAWLFCRSCGLDRDSALGFGAQVPPLEVVPTVQSMEAVRIPKARDEKAGDVVLSCPRCAAAITEYTQFCEICGQDLTSTQATIQATFQSADSLPAAVHETSNESSPVDDEVYVTTLESEIPAIEPAALAPQDEITKIEDENITELTVSGIEDELQPARKTDFNTPRDTSRQDPNVRLTVEQRAISTGRMEEEASNDKGRLYVVPDISQSASFKKPAVPPPPPPPRRPAMTVTGEVDSNPFLSPDEELALEIEDDFNNAKSLDYLEETMAARHPHAFTPRSTRGSTPYSELGGKRRRSIPRLESIGVILALVVLGVLLTVITWQATRNRSGPTTAETLRTTPTAGSTPAVQSSPAAASAGPTTPEDMVYVRGGTFLMGRNDGDDYERPAKTVSVPAFFIDRTEVTNEQYQKFVDATNHVAPSHWQGRKFAPGEGKLPVVFVSWDDAVAYARWAKKRLPTEAEWELAARGNDGRIYPWGSKWIATNANTKDAGRGRIADVGSFPQGSSPSGALDMSGNVWEWTSSDLSSYEDRQTLLPGKVIRGGAFDVASNVATATYRGVVRRDKGYEKTGFRCVRSIR